MQTIVSSKGTTASDLHLSQDARKLSPTASSGNPEKREPVVKTEALPSKGVSS
jgi:hypothetical protein